MPPNGADEGRPAAYELLHNEPDEIDLAVFSPPERRVGIGEPSSDGGPRLDRTSQPSDSPRDYEPANFRTTSNTPIIEESTPNHADGPRNTSSSQDQPDASDWFGTEVTGVVVSAALLAGMIGLLHYYNRKPQPNWPYTSLNSVVSWRSTLSKASLMFSVGEILGQLKWLWFAQQERPLQHLRAFDSASRGAWGSLQLFWALHIRTLAGIGALSMILALGFDPFSQNLVHTYPGLIVDPLGTARIANLSAYNTTGPWITDTYKEISNDGQIYYVDPVLKANVYNSLFNRDHSQPWATPQYFCSSGNCTWDAPVTAFEVRPTCTNITSKLTTKCHPAGFIFSDITFDRYGCIVSLPTRNIFAIYFPGELGISELMTFGIIDITFNGSLAYNTATDRVAGFQYIGPRATTKQVTERRIPNNSQWEATECLLEPIVRRFYPRVDQNDYAEDKPETWSSTDKNWDETGYSMPYGVNYDPSVPSLMTWNAFHANYFFLYSIFSGAPWRNKTVYYETGVQDWVPTYNLYAATDALQALEVGDIVGCSDILAERLNCTMQNVAAAMTKTFRDAAYLANPATAPMVSGQAKISAVFISVHWWWLVLPLFLWALGATVVLLTLWRTRRARVPAWRNDTLPLLFLYQSGGERRGLDRARRLVLHDAGGGPGRASGHEMVRLCEDEGRVLLSQRDGHPHTA